MAKRGRKRRTVRLPPVLSRAGKTAMFLVLIALIGAAYAWHEGRDWRPDEELWPDQGALVSAGDGAVDFDTLAGLGAQFVYLEASDGAARVVLRLGATRTSSSGGSRRRSRSRRRGLDRT